MSKYTKLIHAGLALIAILSVGGEGRSKDPEGCERLFRVCMDGCYQPDSPQNCVSDCMGKNDQCMRNN
jgi:hypothetical protein